MSPRCPAPAVIWPWLQMEHSVMRRLIQNVSSDFYEGVRAQLVDKASGVGAWAQVHIRARAQVQVRVRVRVRLRVRVSVSVSVSVSVTVRVRVIGLRFRLGLELDLESGPGLKVGLEVGLS